LQHLAVSPRFRERGIGSALVEACLARLKSMGILKTHIDVLVGNQPAQEFWCRRGWHRRDDIYRYSFLKSCDTNA
jgi:ribosomal protein S18 acetylase RimI-like enzyme